ncbi:MAG: hypothetical protein ACRCY3_03675, partial [Sphingorhabdus sp.]
MAFDIIDGSTIESAIHAGGGDPAKIREALDTLFIGHGRIVILKDVINEIDGRNSGAPDAIKNAFRSWYDDNFNAANKLNSKIITPDWTIDASIIDDINDADTSPFKGDRGDRAIVEFARNSQADWVGTATRPNLNADIAQWTGSTDNLFRVVTDDQPFFQNLSNQLGRQGRNAKLKKFGLVAMPPQGFGGYLAGLEVQGKIDAQKIATYGTNINIQNRTSNRLKPAMADAYISKANADARVKAKLEGQPRNILGNEEGSTRVAYGVAAGMSGLAVAALNKIGLVDDIITFIATASEAEELYALGDTKAANKLWMGYLFETFGGFAGGGIAAGIAFSRGAGWGSILAGIAGGFAGSYLGGAAGRALYDAFPEYFDPLLEAAHDKIEAYYDAGSPQVEAFVLATIEKFGFDYTTVDGTSGKDFIYGAQFGNWQGLGADDILIGWDAYGIKAGEPVNPDDPTSNIAEEDYLLKLDGGTGNDWVIAIEGEKAITAGGLGKDWVYNTSAKGIIWGDVENSFKLGDGTRGYIENGVVKTIADDASNADVFWYASDTTIMDAGKYDRLKLYGITLTGGDTTATSAALTVSALASPLFGAGLAGAAAAVNLGRMAADLPLIYFDRFVPFITYKLVDGDEAGTQDLIVGNVLNDFLNLFDLEDVDTGPRGTMVVKDFDRGAGRVFSQPGDLGISLDDFNPLALLSLIAPR